jgi:hypothetical protein
MAQSHKNRRIKKTPKTNVNYWIAVTLLVIAGVGFIVWQTTQSDNFKPAVEGAPRIEVLNRTVDHGDVQVNDRVTSAFEIKNVGDKNLHIRNQPYVEIIQGCCPPQVKVSKQVVKPGETATVFMTYTMHAGMDGPHEMLVHLNTNDPLEPETLFTAYSNWVQ